MQQDPLTLAIGSYAVLHAGHASAVLQNRWYILGGGNNARGCTDMVSLDLTTLVSSSSPAEQQVASCTPQGSLAHSELCGDSSKCGGDSFSPSLPSLSGWLLLSDTSCFMYTRQHS